jgi:FkbM family methyltransferase
MTLNKLDEARITIVNAAVGDHDGELDYQPHPYSFLGMVSKESIDIYDLKYSAPMVRLDDYFFQQGTDPDLLKIDLDGYEMLALRGMSRILKQTTPDLLLEVHPSLLLGLGSSASKVCDFLREFNYRFFSMPGSRYTSTLRLTQIFDFNSITVDGTMLFVTAGNRHNIVGNMLELSPFE